MSALPLGECQQRCIGQLAGIQPFSERKAALSAVLRRRPKLISRLAATRTCGLQVQIEYGFFYFISFCFIIVFYKLVAGA
jgi:hypothetical protein